jgi:hypothetical protein
MVKEVYHHNFMKNENKTFKVLSEQVVNTSEGVIAKQPLHANKTIHQI